MYKLKILTVKIKPFAKHELQFFLLKIVLKTLRTIFLTINGYLFGIILKDKNIVELLSI